MESEVLSKTHQSLLRLGLAPNRSLVNLRVHRRVLYGNKNLVSVTTPIRFPEFYRQTLKCFKAVAYLSMHAKKHLHVISSRQKSNEWMAVLFADFLQRMNWSKRVSMDIVEYESARNGGLKDDALIVFFDDMSYSGIQLDEYIRSIPGKRDRGIIIAVPFLTRTALDLLFFAIEMRGKRTERLNDEEEEQMYNFNMLIYGKLVPTIREVDRLLARKYGNKAAVYFNHKIADNISSYPKVYHRYIPENVSHPFYKKRTVRLSAETKSDPNFESYVSTLPPPHTKYYGKDVHSALTDILINVYHIELPGTSLNNLNYGHLNSGDAR